MSLDTVKIYFDGGSRGNPGPAAGAAFTDCQGGRQRACFLDSATNNEAEYRGLLMAIELAKELQLTQVTFLGDSKLVVMQVSGEWQAKHPMMQDLKQQAIAALRAIPRWSIQWIKRELNGEADRIANEEMDRKLGIEALPVELIKGDSIDQATAEPETGIRPDISKINRLGSKAGFADFRQLKVGGTDAFSRASLSSLEELLLNYTELHEAFTSRLAMDRLTESLPEVAKAKLLLNALRWSARGLKGDLALRKVLVDLEITNNIRGKRR